MSDAPKQLNYDAVQKRLIVAFARQDANPYQLLDHWLNGSPPRSGFAWLKKPDLDAKTWQQLAALHAFATAELTQLARYAAGLASLLLYEHLFPADFAHRPRVTDLLEEWDPIAETASVVLRTWGKNGHRVHAAYFDMRSVECVRLSTQPLEALAVLGIAKPQAPRRLRA